MYGTEMPYFILSADLMQWVLSRCGEWKSDFIINTMNVKDEQKIKA